VEKEPDLIVPTGTRIVTQADAKGTTGELIMAGSAGVVVGLTSIRPPVYAVRFADGGQASLPRREIRLLKHMQGSFREPAAAEPLFRFVIYRCVVGSRAYGLDEAGSDTDYRGIYLPPSALHWSLGGVPEQLENAATEECYWELQKFLILALKANPNVLECLYTPLVPFATPLAEELIAMRSCFLSRLVYQTYNSYVLSQFKKLERDLRNCRTLKWKQVMHLIRLLLAGIAVLDVGEVPVRVAAERERLLAIRRGEVPWTAVNEWRLELHKQLERAFAHTSLPERPDYERANTFLLKARRSMVST
jgi:hypothetical protein